MNVDYLYVFVLVLDYSKDRGKELYVQHAACVYYVIKEL